MTKEEQELLLKDLTARLPYKVKAQYFDAEAERDGIDTIDGIDLTGNPEILISQYGLNIDEIKQYLRPLSSITVDEICKIENIIGGRFNYDKNGELTLCTEEFIRIPIYKMVNLLQFMYQRHLDFNNLISLGLASEAPEGMYFPKENASYEDYVKYLKEKSLSLDA